MEEGRAVAETEGMLTGVTDESDKGRDSARSQGVTGCHYLYEDKGWWWRVR